MFDDVSKTSGMSFFVGIIVAFQSFFCVLPLSLRRNDF